MVNKKAPIASDPEITAIGAVHDALRELEPAAQRRVLEYVAGKLGLLPPLSDDESRKAPDSHEPLPAASLQASSTEKTGDTEGISSVAVKWMRRSGLTASTLSALFSLGVDEIDLVAEKVPGKSKRQRMHSVLLLKGIAGYLSTGVPRVTHEKIKEACLHYDAFDSPNFAKHLREFSAEVTGTKESGYTLSPRGLTAATQIIRTLAGAGTK
jgi:hypothetical protein